MIKKLVSLASYRYAETVLLYTAIKGEPDVTRELMEAAIASGKRVAFPLCHPESCTLTYHYVSSYDELVLGNYGTKEPSESAPVYEPSPQKHDLLLVPGISYDKKGYRLGYGKGYYDRFLTLFGGTTVGVTFDKLFLSAAWQGKVSGNAARNIEFVYNFLPLVAPIRANGAVASIDRSIGESEISMRLRCNINYLISGGGLGRGDTCADTEHPVKHRTVRIVVE